MIMTSLGSPVLLKSDRREKGTRIIKGLLWNLDDQLGFRVAGLEYAAYKKQS